MLIQHEDGVYTGLHRTKLQRMGTRAPDTTRAQPAFGELHTNTLTPQEREIAVLVAEGLTNIEIATRLCLAPGTVRNYVSSCLSKLYLSNRAALAIWTVRNGMREQVAQPAKEIADPDVYRDLLYGVYS